MKEPPIIEIKVIGSVAKVTAIDPETALEVTIMGPVSAGQAILSQNAVKKLKYMLEKQKEKP